MGIKHHRITLILFLFICTMLNACSEPPGVYIDIKKQAIISCNGIGLKKIRIENDSTEVTLEGTEPIIYFNKKNSARTTIYGDLVYDYVFKLKSNSNYIVTKDNGYDRGPFRITFKTDSYGKVIKATAESCN